MKFIALTYDYNLDKLAEIGRHWAKNVYGGKNYIFEYSAAAYATFIDKNPNRLLHIYTDDIDLLCEKIEQYNIDTKMIQYHDFNPQLEKYKNGLRYSFDVLTDFIYLGKSKNEFTVKIDNDIVFYDKLPENNENDVFVWKYERKINEGNPLMGEIKVAQNVLGRTDIPIYNLGILGLPVNYPEDELRNVCDEMISVDISDVTDVNAKIWHCSEQTANNWIFFKYKYNVVETYHSCIHYYDNKQKCIEEAKYLRK
jgi:hypothetical protein